ncbi:MAG: NAD(P)H-hydrate dehydratase [Bellilinea sp.]|jgi:NAD(P)H-hydrate epimerase
MIRLVTVDEMRAIEREGNARGVSYAEMMERAGRGVARVIAQLFGDCQPRNVLGLVGSGNNGGDALVALETLAAAGWHARAYLARPRPADDVLLRRFLSIGGEVGSLEQDGNYTTLDRWLEQASVLLDGVLGTGAQLPLRAELEAVLAHVRDFALLPSVVAVDCPSGVDCDSGGASPATIKAELTVCLEAVKRGLVQFPAAGLTGRLVVIPLRLPSDLDACRAISLYVTSGDLARAWLPQRPADAHKGTFGTVLVVGGCNDYIGAPALAAEAAYRMGAGLVRVATTPVVRDALAGHQMETTWLALPEQNGGISAAGVETVLSNLERVTALLVGPGIGSLAGTGDFVRGLFTKAKTLPPLVLDAEGLRLTAGLENWANLLPRESVLTPHPGEMSSLTGLAIAEIQADRIGTALRYARHWGHVVVLKGAFSVVASPLGMAQVIPVASAALSRAGSGDVLAGLITGLRAQGLAAFPAAVAAAWIHALAGLAALRRTGQSASVLAGDILRAVPEVIRAIKNGEHTRDPLWVVDA